MSYSHTTLGASIILLPLIALVAGVVYWSARRFRLTPTGVPGPISYALIGCVCYGVLYTYFTADMMIYQPARLQKEYLGRVIGTPISLRYFEHSGFQDPGSEWRYTLRPNEIASLSRQCRSSYRVGDAERCVLFSGSNDRWYAEVSLEGSDLRVVNGAH